MHNHHIALAVADARVADLQSAASHTTTTVPPRRRRHHLRKTMLAGMAVASTFAATPMSFAGPADSRSPTATHEVPPPPSLMAASARKQYEQLRAPSAQAQQDLRSPDARDAARAAQARQDLRSPDARDAAEGRGTYNSPDVVIVKVPQLSPAAATEPSSAGGIDWADAGIGAGGLLGLTLIGLCGALAITHRRRAGHSAPPVARV